MGILLVYDVTDENSFANIRNWIRNIEQHAQEAVNKVLLGNKCDMVDKKVISTERAQALADEYEVALFETSAKNKQNVEEAFYTIATDIKKRLMDNPSAQTGLQPSGIQISGNNANAKARKKSCGNCK